MYELQTKRYYSFRPHAGIIKYIFISFNSFTGLTEVLYKFLYLTNDLTRTCLKRPKVYSALKHDIPNYIQPWYHARVDAYNILYYY